jgi:hypothetical protein
LKGSITEDDSVRASRFLLQIKTGYNTRVFVSGKVLRRDKNPVYKAWQGNMRFIWCQFVGQADMDNFSTCGKGNVSVTTACCFAVIDIKQQWIVAGNIGYKSTVRIRREQLT